MTETRLPVPGSQRFQRLPIERKLLFALLFTAATALLFAGVGIVAADSILFYQFLQRDLGTLSQIIADNSTGALAFDESERADEILQTLRSRDHVVSACLLRPDGSMLAQYSRNGAPCPVPHASRVEGSFLQQLDVTQVVRLAGGQSVGTLTLSYELTEIMQRVWLYGGLVLGVLVLASFLAVALSRRLRTLIAAPILELAGLVSSVTRSKNYSLRARRHAPDEVGTLVTAFNEMLTGIESRDDELRQALAAQRSALVQIESANTDLQKANDDLARSYNDLERFAFIASHDLQEPLRMVTSYTQLLVKQYPPDAGGQQRVYMDRIVEGTRRMRQMLLDLLTYAEVSASTGPSGDPVNMNKTLAKVMENLQPAIDASGATISSDPLPWLVADERHLTSLLQNLIANSLKYHGTLPPKIQVTARHTNGDTVVFGVADNGIGIEAQYRKTIFTAFKRLHGSEIPGTGIGLTICQRIVDRYKGKIWIEPNEGNGVIFYFTLPEADAQWRQAY